MWEEAFKLFLWNSIIPLLWNSLKSFLWQIFYSKKLYLTSKAFSVNVEFVKNYNNFQSFPKNKNFFSNSVKVHIISKHPFTTHNIFPTNFKWFERKSNKNMELLWVCKVSRTSWGCNLQLESIVGWSKTKFFVKSDVSELLWLLELEVFLMFLMFTCKVWKLLNFEFEASPSSSSWQPQNFECWSCLTATINKEN